MKPKLRFKGFDEEWKRTSLGQLSKGFQYGLNAAAKPFDGENKYLRITDIEESTRKFSNDDLTSPDFDISQCEEYLLSEGEIVVARTGASVGKSYIYHKEDGKVFFAGFLIRSVIKDIADSNFIFYNTLTKSYNNYIKLVSQRSGQPGVNANELKEYLLFIPPNKENQSAIGDYFQKLDGLITAAEAKIEGLRKVKAASLQAMFPQEGETKPRLRFKGFDEEWRMRRIGSMGFFYSGISGKQKDDFGIGNAQYITFLNVLSNAHIDISILENVNINANEGQNQVRKGDLFFNTSSETPEEVGMCSVLIEDVQNVYLNSFCFGFRPTTTELSPQFFAYLMRSFIGRSIMRILAQGATRYNLSKSNLASTNILMPSTKAEQQKIADYFANLDRQIMLEEQRLEKLRQIKVACLDNMFV